MTSRRISETAQGGAWQASAPDRLGFDRRRGDNMEAAMTAIEMSGTLDEHGQLRLDGPVPIPGPMRVRVLILCPLSDEWSETDWLPASARNPASAFLDDLEKDLHTLDDEEPFSDQV